jgi:hypothetical protein
MLDPLITPGFIPVDWLLDYEPPWLGPAIMLIGAALLILSYLFYQKSHTLQLGVIVAIATVAALPWAWQNSQLIVILLSFTGSWFQGVGTVRGYLKLKHYAGKIKSGLTRLRSRLGSQSARESTSNAARSGNSSMLGSMPKKALWWLVFQLLGLLAVVTSVWVGVGLSTIGPLTIPTLTTDIVIVWTLLTAFGAFLGLGWRFWSVRGAFPATSLIGVICIAAGAEIYNFRTLETEVALFLAAKGVYVLGFLGAVALVILVNRSPESYTDQEGISSD